MKIRHFPMAALAICILFGLVITIQYRPLEIEAQVRISDTPVRVILPDATQVTPQANILTATPTFTPTEPPPSVFLEAAAPLGDILVLDFPETGLYLGSLERERQYPITGQYYSWIQFEYPASPNGLGWVYYETVRVVGDIAAINIISDPNAANASPEDNQTATAEAELLTPSIAETASAEARILSLPTESAISDNQGQGAFLPTYTPPADIVVRAPTQVPGEVLATTPTPSFIDNAVSLTTRRLPPIAPILILGGFGLLGLLVSLIRRG
jgi:hypothetical protein